MGIRPSSNLESELFDFACVKEGCGAAISFSMGAVAKEPAVTCPACGSLYRFQPELIDKFGRFADLLAAVRAAQDILGDVNVGIQVESHSVRIPYRLLLTRLNTLLTLEMGGRTIDFHVRVHPLSDLEGAP